jgi:hypothetical protein
MRLDAIADELIARIATSNRVRLPVQNHEPRPAISKQLRLGLWMRDSGLCWIGGHAVVKPVADHVRPRSAWPADLIPFADRSDNLRLACWDCNTDKSNYLYPGGDGPLGITTWCLRCNGSTPADSPVCCFCMRCGMGGLVSSTSAYLSAEEACAVHPFYPARDCPRCTEEAVAS